MSDRHRDAEERAAELGAPVGRVDGRTLTPMMAERSGADLAAPGWLYELKLDGVRILADVTGGDVRLLYRKSRDTTASYPEVVEALAKLGAPRLVLDGEIVAFDEHGRPSFERLGQRIQHRDEGDVRLVRKAVPVLYVIFDLLAVGERDLRSLPLSARKELLGKVLPPEARGDLRLLDSFEDDGRPLFELCQREKLEGIIAKRASSPYRPGVRGPDWVKVKRETDDEFVVVGFTEDKNGGLGALDLAAFDGDRLVLRGEVGSGIDRKTAARLLTLFKRADGPTASGEYERDVTRTHVVPELVVSVRYLEWSESGRLRFPTFRGIRDDVEPSECRAAPLVARPLDFGAAEAQRRAPGPLEPYFAAVAGALLPYVAGRSVVVNGKSLAIDDRAALVAFAEKASAGPDILAARLASKDRPEWVRLIIVGRRGALADVARVAGIARALLESIGLVPLVKTAGGATLDVLAPAAGLTWDTQRALAALLARLVEERAGKLDGVRLDASGNGPKQSMHAPYAALPGGRGEVSTPLSWDEVDLRLDPARFTTKTVPARLATRVDPMLPLLAAAPDVTLAVMRLQEMLKR